MDIKAYIEQEKRGGADNRNEYIKGKLRELKNGDDKHFSIRLNFSFLLKEHLSRQEQCRIYMGDMKVYVAAAEALLYPDIFVTCADSDGQQNDYKECPLLIVEIVTEASGNFDRGQKFGYYRQLPSLQAYVLIDATLESVDCFERDAEQQWYLNANIDNQHLHLKCLDFKCDIADIYQDIFAEDDED
jgi:Uma2 family endonuclease